MPGPFRSISWETGKAADKDSVVGMDFAADTNSVADVDFVVDMDFAVSADMETGRRIGAVDTEAADTDFAAVDKDSGQHFHYSAAHCYSRSDYYP